MRMPTPLRLLWLTTWTTLLIGLLFYGDGSFPFLITAGLVLAYFIYDSASLLFKR